MSRWLSATVRSSMVCKSTGAAGFKRLSVRVLLASSLERSMRMAETDKV